MYIFVELLNKMNHMKRLLFCSLALVSLLAATAQTEPGDTLREVTVGGVRRQVVYRMDRRRIDAQQVLSAAGGTAADVLQTMPSVLTDADGNITFRGSGNFLVYIDGKPSPLEGTAALRQIPASTIRSIELLTTPGARYRADGDVGIIHITTLRGEGEGLSGMLNGSATTLGGWGGVGQLNLQRGRNRWWANMQANRYRGASDFRQEKTTLVDDYLTTSRSDGDRFRTERAYIGTVGWQYAVEDRHLLSVDLQSGQTRNRRGGDMDYHEERQLTTEPGSLRVGDYDSHDRYVLQKELVQLSAAYEWHINERGDLLSLKSRNRYDWHSLEYTESNMFTPDALRYEGTRGYEKEHHWDCDEQLDYKWQYRPTGALETGYQYVTYSEIGDYNIKYWDRPKQDFEWQDDLRAPFDYHRQVHSLYATLSDHFGKLSADIGLRMDRVRDEMTIAVAGADRDRRRLEFYPSAHLAYNTRRGTFGAGYARRTNRPGIWKMEPYITYEDYYTKKIGNPDIDPEYIHSLELNYHKSFEGGHSLHLTAYQRWRTGVVDEIRVAYEPGVTLDSIINAGDQKDRGLEMSLVVKPLRRWTTTLNADVQDYRFTATYAGCTSAHGTTYALGSINQIALAKHTQLQFDGHVVGPRRLTQGRERAYCYFDLAARQQLLGGRMALSLVAHDAFRTARYHNWRTTPSLRSETRVRPHYPNLTLSLSYYFRQKAKEQQAGAVMKGAVFEGKDF